MKINQLLGIYEVEKGVRKIDISIQRVILWALIFTNGFAVFYFFAKWLKLA
jgi:hypothetical protein